MDNFKPVLGILGGLALYEPDFMDSWEPIHVDTPYGKVQYLYKGKIDGKDVLFWRRWFWNGEICPPTALYKMQRAAMYAFKQLGCQHVVVHDGAGSINPDYELGDFVLLEDFIDFTAKNYQSYFTELDDPCINTIFDTPFCAESNQVAVEAAKSIGIPLKSCVLAVTEGPRFETPAEIRFFAQIGADAVAQGVLPEAVFAREMGLCYTAIYSVCNYATGVKRSGDWNLQEMSTTEYDIMDKVHRLMRALVHYMPETRTCNCAHYNEDSLLCTRLALKNKLLSREPEPWED